MSKKISQLARSNPGNQGELVPSAYGGSNFARRADAFGGEVSVTEWTGVSTDGVTDSTTGLTTALAAAAAGSFTLFWPSGTYLTTASIPLLHTVRHRGPGIIKRGSDLFYVSPKYGQTNRLYVAPTGSSANDGLTTSQPMATPQNSFDALRNYGPMLNGSWNIKCAAGTTVANTQTHDTPSRDWVVIQGPDVSGSPNVPTYILDGTGAGANKHGFVVNGQGVQLWVQDIKFTNYNAGTQNSCGIAQGYAARLYARNVHATNCDFAGVLADQGDICLVGGGIYNGCRSGVVINATKATIGYGASGLATGTTFTGCTQNSVYWSRGAQGHVDYCSFINSPYHVQIESAARCHVLGNDFRTATAAAITTNTDGSYYEDVSTPNVYNDGTGNANLRRYLHYAFTGRQQNWTDVSLSEMRLYFDDTVRTLTSAAKAQIGADLALPTATGALPVSYFTSRFSRIRIKVWGETPNAVTQIGVDFYNAVPGVKVMDYRQFVGTPAAGGFEYELVIHPSTSAVQRAFGNLVGTGIVARVDSGATTADMSLAQTIRLMGQSASGTITVRGIEVWVMG